MKARHFIIVMLASLGFLVGCSKYFNSSEDPEMSFNDQMAAFDSPALTPDDQMPAGYDQARNDRYQAPTTDSDDPMYPSSNDSAYADADDQPAASKPHAASMGGGGAEEVPFSETRRTKTPPNIGAS